MSMIADALNGIPRQSHYQAKRGDLALFAFTSAYTMAHGQRHTETTWQLRRVTNTTRDGRVTGYQSIDGTQCKPRAGITFPCMIVSASKLSEVEGCFRALGRVQFSSPESARDAIRFYA